MASVTFDRVVKEYDDGVVAVCDLSLRVEDGELIVLVGPSGCGKTTTLRMVAGLESITSGAVSIGDRVVSQVQPCDRDIAMVFQNYALYPHMSVRKNLAFALKMRKTPRDQIAQRVAWAAELLGLESLLDRKPRALSGGQRQRVALGRAIVRKPAVFLFDEPLSNLDAKLRVQMRAEIKRLHRELKTTTIYVTHDQEEAMSLGDRVAVMNDGVMRQCDAPLVVYHRPADRFVAGFLGMPPMNFCDGRLEHAEGRLWFVADSVRLAIQPGPNGVRADSGPAVAGFRPEAIDLLRDRNASGENNLTAVVLDVEPLGSLMDVRLRVEALPTLVCRTAARPVNEGDAAIVHIPPDRIHVFPVEQPSPSAGALDQSGAAIRQP